MIKLNLLTITSIILLAQASRASLEMSTDFTSSDTPISIRGDQNFYLYEGNTVFENEVNPAKCFYTLQIKREAGKSRLIGIGHDARYYYDLDQLKGLFNYASVEESDKKSILVSVGNVVTTQHKYFLALNDLGKLSSVKFKHHDRAASMVLANDPIKDHETNCVNLKNVTSINDITTKSTRAAYAIMRIDAFKNGFPKRNLDRKTCYSFPPQSAKVVLTGKLKVISGLAESGIQDGSSCDGNWNNYPSDINRGKCMIDGRDLDVTDRIDHGRIREYPRAIEIKHNGRSLFLGFCE